MNLFIVPIIMWWTYYVVRLFNHARDEQFLKMPWMYLWLAGYNVAWCYTLNHFWVLERLESSIFSFTQFPIASLLFVSVYLIQLTSFLWMVQRAFTQLLRVVFLVLVTIYAIAVGAHLTQLPYVTLYRIDIILIYISTLMGGFTLLYILRKQIRFPASHIEFAHLCWFSMFCILSSIGLGLITLNAVAGLPDNLTVVETPLQAIGYSLNALAMASLMILTGPDTWLYRSIYPYRLWQYHKLLQMKDFILHHIEIDPIITHSSSEKPLNIEIAIHETMVTVLDYYPYLLGNDVLRNNLATIEANSQDLETMLFKITRLRLPAPD